MSLDLSTFTLTFNDDFNTFNASPDGNGAWKTQFYFGGRSLPSNGEQQYYSDASVGVDPFHLQDGSLTITAAPGNNPDHLPYTSGLITTEGTFSQTYGYFEMRAELPQGQGMWPAFWLLNADHSWPAELDVFEAFGAPNAHGEGGTTHAHINAISSDVSQGGGSWVDLPNGGDTSTGYHTYGVDWEPDHLTYYIDSQQVAQLNTPSDLNKPMYMLANLAVGGTWVGAPAGETGQMKIDYIRAYSHDAPAGTVPINGEGQPSQPDSVAHTDTSAPTGASAPTDVASLGMPPADAAPPADMPPVHAPHPEVATTMPPHTDWLHV